MGMENGHFARALQARREELGMTKTALERATGIARQAIRAYETGHRRPTPASASKLAAALETTAAQLLWPGEEGAP